MNFKTVSFSPLINQLLNALCCLPSVGPKSAQRMAFYLLDKNRDKAIHLAQALQQAMEKIRHCQNCNILSETDQCQICSNQSRDSTLLCIVESPADVIAIEQCGSYRGLYFVLMGHLSPLDGIGPEDIGLVKLHQQLGNNHIKEIILATNSTVEGETTAHYIAQMVKPHHIKTSRIAHGIPMGGELEFIDGNTISQALISRQNVYDEPLSGKDGL
ncbi:MAG: recombination mediator RecR [Gammaproteobacteria bacterium]